MSDEGPGPLIRARVTLERMQIAVVHAFTEAIAPMAEDIKNQVQAAVEKMDFGYEFAQMVEYEVRETLRKKVRDLIKEITESDEFAEQARKVAEAKVQKDLERRIEEEVRSQVDMYVRRQAVDLINGDLRSVVDKQLAMYKGQKDSRPWWKRFGRG